jgi:predicted small secreted protein
MIFVSKREEIFMRSAPLISLTILLSLSISACSTEPEVIKPKLFGKDCEKISSKIKESAEVDKNLINSYISKNQAEEKHRRILSYYRTYEKVRKATMTRDQRLFLNDIKENEVDAIYWIKYYMDGATSLQWDAFQILTLLKVHQSTAPCGTLTYDEWVNEKPLDN